MAKISLTRFSDTTSTESALKHVMSGRWSDPNVGVACAWLLRQSSQENAVTICQHLLRGTVGRSRGKLSETNTGYLKLTLAEYAFLHARQQEASTLAREAEDLFASSRSHKGLSDACYLQASIVGERGDGALRRRLMERSLEEARLADDKERVDTSWLTLQIFNYFSGESGARDAVSEVQAQASSSVCGVRALAHCYLMSYEMDTGRVTTAIQHGMQAFSSAMEAGFWSRAIIDGLNVGIFLFDLEDLDGALGQCQPILELARKVRWPASLSASCSVVATILSKLQRHEGALRMAQEAVEVSSVLPTSRNHLKCMVGAAECASAMGRYGDAERWYVQVKTSARGAENESLRAYACLGLGKVYARTGRDVEAVNMGSLALKWAVGACDTTCRVDSLRLLAGLSGKGDHEDKSLRSAVELLEEAVSAAKQASDTAVSYGLLVELATALEGENRHLEAVAVLKDAVRRLEIARAGEAERRGAALEVRYKTELALKEAEGARREAEIQEAKALELETLNSQLREAMDKVEATRALLLRRNEELTVAYGKISELSIRDPLTGLHNRRFFEEAIEAAVSEARRAYRPSMLGELDTEQQVKSGDLLFFMLDMDHFKAVNDQYGHAAGDAVLVQLKDRLRSVTREVDFVVRWGGEEFLIAFRAVSRDEGKLLAERLLLCVSCAPFSLPGGIELRKTVSIGWAAFPQDTSRPDEGSWQAVVELADARLYEAKRGGRNKALGDPGRGGNETRPCGEVAQVSRSSLS